ncbi:hypothetical protein [Paraflavitalea speifideaquila]|uniref:hypothetical protein n=1 Tax=Paraflavitalea speifideaquila TaxID=3076558 RepID=UPI0028E265A7|nr:hypothetical protein [Paraflavitalea speifideiaquila]
MTFSGRVFKLPESEAQKAVEAIEDVYKERSNAKHAHTVDIIHKDMQTLKEHMDIKFEYLKEYMDTKFSTKEEQANSRTDLVKWMFLFGLARWLLPLGLYYSFEKIINDPAVLKYAHLFGRAEALKLLPFLLHKEISM